MSLRAIIWCAVSTKGQAVEEKDSLPTQEADARAKCDAEGWEVVDVLKVPGHSRNYIDIHECARDMRKNGIDAFDKLIRHWEDRDFDVLVARDGDRFARTQHDEAESFRPLPGSSHSDCRLYPRLPKNQRLGTAPAFSDLDSSAPGHRLTTGILPAAGPK